MSKKESASNEFIGRLRNHDRTFDNQLYATIVKGGNRYLKDLFEGLANEDPMVREGCVEALGEIGNPAFIPILVDHGSDPNWHVRWDIKNSLNMIFDVFPIDVIANLTNCYQLRQRHVFQKKLKRLYDDLFPRKSEPTISWGVSLIMEGKTDEGIQLIMKGLGKKYATPKAIKRRLARLLTKKGLHQEARDIERLMG